jgi:hypothetical protein
MMASPYVRPFAEEVRGWEQKLSLVSETIEVWMLVQRKWMYLESIFVGSDDIRNQLPQEAKRFDTIDRSGSDGSWTCCGWVCTHWSRVCFRRQMSQLWGVPAELTRLG